MFDNIKIGDKVALIKTVGINHWNTALFGKDFVVHLTVERVTKTQFTAGGVRFKKCDGYEFGAKRSNRHVNKIISDFNEWGKSIDLTIDGSIESLEYEKEIYSVSGKLECANGLFNMKNCKTINDVKTALQLLDKLAAIAPYKRS